MNVNISAEKLQEIVEECYSIELGEIFPEDIYEILYRTRLINKKIFYLNFSIFYILKYFLVF